MVPPEEKCLFGPRIFIDLAYSYDFIVALFSGRLVALIFVMATFVVYMMTPKLMNLRGSILCGYLTSYVGGAIVFSTSSASLRYLVGIHSCNLLIVIVSSIWYFVVASMCWLNVMCFDVWKSFRGLRSDQDFDISEDLESKYKNYSQYAWGGPAILMLLLVGCALALNTDAPGVFGFLLTIAFLPAAMITICTISFMILTRIAIKKEDNEMARLFDHVDSVQQENKLWFSSCVQLFLLMKIPMLLLGAGIYWQNFAVFIVGCASEALQGYLIFWIFLFKKIPSDRSICRRRNIVNSKEFTVKSLPLLSNGKTNDNLERKKINEKKRSRNITKTFGKIVKKFVTKH